MSDQGRYIEPTSLASGNVHFCAPPLPRGSDLRWQCECGVVWTSQFEIRFRHLPKDEWVRESRGQRRRRLNQERKLPDGYAEGGA